MTTLPIETVFRIWDVLWVKTALPNAAAPGLNVGFLSLCVCAIVVVVLFYLQVSYIFFFFLDIVICEVTDTPTNIRRQILWWMYVVCVCVCVCVHVARALKTWAFPGSIFSPHACLPYLRSTQVSIYDVM